MSYDAWGGYNKQLYPRYRILHQHPNSRDVHYTETVSWFLQSPTLQTYRTELTRAKPFFYYCIDVSNTYIGLCTLVRKF